MSDYDVIVAGAGPVGAVAAWALARSGIRVGLFEAGPDCALDLRASTLHAPTLAMLDALDLLDQLGSQGLRAPIYQHRVRKTGEVLEFDLGEIADVVAHPYRLQCEQFKLARLASTRVATTPGCDVRFRSRIRQFDQDGDGVTVFVETPTGAETWRAKFLIGADGASSLVRKGLDVAFKGFTYDEKFLTLSTAYPLEDHFDRISHVNYVADPDEWFVLLRVPLVWRMMVPATPGMADDALLSDANKDALFDRLIGAGGDVATEHRTIYRVHQRVAAKFRVGRVALIGDAAHVNNPLGGFGMNSGLHDAVNIVDKIVHVLLDGGPIELLDIFARQRRRVALDFVQAQTIANKRSMEASRSGGADHHEELRMIHRDPDRRRAYLLRQSMVQSIADERAIA